MLFDYMNSNKDVNINVSRENIDIKVIARL
jgi:hypothetical protein